MTQFAPYYLLDVFTDTPFGGNPLAVFPDADDLTAEQMLTMTKELNLSEAVFVQKADNEAADCRVRIFTPGMEMPTAGHPTIGVSYMILKQGWVKPAEEGLLKLQQNVGIIPVSYEIEAGTPKHVTMQQPNPEFGNKFTDSGLIASLLSIDVDDIMEDYPCQIVSCGNPFLIVPLETKAAVDSAKLNMTLFENIIDEVFLTGIMLFSLQTDAPDSTSYSRMFAPHIGVPEDPATGSAHGPLVAYINNYQLKTETSMVGEQGYLMKRPSKVQMEVKLDDTKIAQVFVGGNCVMVGKGELLIP